MPAVHAGDMLGSRTWGTVHGGEVIQAVLQALAEIGMTAKPHRHDAETPSA